MDTQAPSSEYRSPRFGTMIALSVLFHFIVFFLLASFSFSISKKDFYYRPVYQVDLVSLPRPKTTTPKVKKNSVTSKKQVHKIVEKPKKIKKKTSKKKIKKKKKAVIAKKKKVPVAKKKKVQTKKEPNEADYLKSALNKIKKSAASKDKSQNKEKQLASKFKFPGDSPYQLSSSEYQSHHFNMYYNKVWEEIRAEWVLPGDMIEKIWEAIIAIRISKSGHIVNSTFEKRSGNIYFDQSVMRAIKKADPLSPLPPGYTKNYLDIGIRFHSFEYQNG
jgi:colicin import membrane protein